MSLAQRPLDPRTHRPLLSFAPLPHPPSSPSFHRIRLLLSHLLIVPSRKLPFTPGTWLVHALMSITCTAGRWKTQPLMWIRDMLKSSSFPPLFPSLLPSPPPSSPPPLWVSPGLAPASALLPADAPPGGGGDGHGVGALLCSGAAARCGGRRPHGGGGGSRGRVPGGGRGRAPRVPQGQVGAACAVGRCISAYVSTR